MNSPDFRGAESTLFLDKWFDLQAIYKIRHQKEYRIKELDLHFRKQRTIHEARLLTKAKIAGIRTPIIFEIDIPATTLVMEYIKGETVKTLIPKLTQEESQKLSYDIGTKIGLLHTNNIIHGDLTTSNIIYHSVYDQLVFIDFGLGYFSDKEEDFGIDVFLFERAIHNTHPNRYQNIWKAFLKGYRKTAPYGENIEKKIQEIRSRGRYSERM